jgi:hypothetical protein
MKANNKARGIVEDESAMIQTLPTVAFAVIMLFAILYIGTYINGTISSTLVASYGAAGSRTELQNRSINTMTNLTTDYDDVIEIVTVAAIITVLTIPLMAVVAMKRFF